MRAIALVALPLASGCAFTSDAFPVTFACGDGTELKLRFDNAANAAFLRLPNGNEARMEGQPVASGFHYRGSGYDLRGKGRQAWFAAHSGPRLDCAET